MNRTKLFLLLCLTVSLVLSMASCNRLRQTDTTPNVAYADSLMEAAHLAHDTDRIFALADSLEAAGVYSTIKADYWRGYSHYANWNERLCQEYWYEAVSLEAKDREDLIFYGRASNRLSDVMLGKGDYESAMRIAIPAIEKMREEGLSVCRDYGYLLITVGCCELNNRNKEMADAYFEEAYNLFNQLLANNGEDGGATHEDNLKSAVAGYTTIAKQLLADNLYSDVILWLDRLDEVIEDYRRQPETTQESIDRRLALSRIYRASALEGMGNHREAAAVYDDALNYDFCSSPQGRVEATKYLILAKRWNEAAENYKLLDEVNSIFGAGLTLDNIQIYLMPKFRANFNARRSDDALATGIQLCDALDSAIVWNRGDKAAELATIYHTQEIKQDFVEQQAYLGRLRFASAVAIIVLLIISFLVFVFFRHRSSLRLEEAYQDLEVANARAEEASQVKTAFLQQISHEVGTPLNLLSGFAQVLTTPGMELDDESRAEINQGVIANTGRITSLVHKMLELSNLMSMSSLEKNDNVSPREIADSAVVTSGINSAQDIDFEIRGSGEMDFTMMLTNKRAAAHVLALLLENAVKYTEKGNVCLRIVIKSKHVYFFVEDTGIGVPKEEAEHIFEQFVQLDDYREGTGIGLTVARSLARRLGGDVILDTSYTFGARFVFSIPR